ncbi:hypothetical protein, partial [Streptomyces albireticuli]|uniref:hypothetical protein n=1 Tax=Streptomyces albireticuli TaxID=1940 RepID=UPI001B80749F
LLDRAPRAGPRAARRAGPGPGAFGGRAAGPAAGVAVASVSFPRVDLPAGEPFAYLDAEAKDRWSLLCLRKKVWWPKDPLAAGDLRR